MKQRIFKGEALPKRLNLEQLTIDIAAFVGKSRDAIQVSASTGGTVKTVRNGRETVQHHEPHITVNVPDDVATRDFGHIVARHSPPQTDHEAVAARERARKIEELRPLLKNPEFVTLLKDALK